MKLVFAPDFQEDQLESGVGCVRLYKPKSGEIGGIGHPIIHSVTRSGIQPSKKAWDFLTIALAVIAGDTFVLRSKTADGWSRRIQLEITLNDPAPWEDVKEELRLALDFLTGDSWELTFVSGPVKLPTVETRLVSEDSVCLFSGGLDSLIGAIDLVSQGKKPLLISHAYPKDGQIQRHLHQELLSELNILQFNADARWQRKNETSMRARSFLFIALGAVFASSQLMRNPQGKTPLFIPENGLISLNVPLTPRRIGSLSTRTTHPYYLAGLQKVFDKVGLAVEITNPYRFKTKGEMLAGCSNPQLIQSLAHETVSCGKWKRKNRQCGRCYPCIIRRASFHKAGMPDRSEYLYEIASSLNYDDVRAVIIGAKRAETEDTARWVSTAAPVSDDASEKLSYTKVFERGMDELRTFLTHTIRS